MLLRNRHGVLCPNICRGHTDALTQAHGLPGLWRELRKFGEDISEILEYVPAHFQVIRQVRPS